MIQAPYRWCSPESLRIYARINPRDYAARVRRMPSTDADSALEANLPVLDDSALHANLANTIGPLENGRDIADTCAAHEELDEESDDGPAAAAASASSAPAPAPCPAPRAQPRCRRCP